MMCGHKLYCYSNVSGAPKPLVNYFSIQTNFFTSTSKWVSNTRTTHRSLRRGPSTPLVYMYWLSAPAGTLINPQFTAPSAIAQAAPAFLRQTKTKIRGVRALKLNITQQREYKIPTSSKSASDTFRAPMSLGGSAEFVAQAPLVSDLFPSYSRIMIILFTAPRALCHNGLHYYGLCAINKSPD